MWKEYLGPYPTKAGTQIQGYSCSPWI